MSRITQECCATLANRYFIVMDPGLGSEGYLGRIGQQLLSWDHPDLLAFSTAQFAHDYLNTKIDLCERSRCSVARLRDCRNRYDLATLVNGQERLILLGPA
jgi:hypothetical protein